MRQVLRNALRTSGLAVGGLMLASALAACYQPAGSGLEATSVSFAAATFTLEPSITPIPTDTPDAPPTATWTPGLTLVAVTNTIDPVSDAYTQVAMAQVQGDPLILTATALAQLAQFQSQQIQDPLILTATAMANLQALQVDPDMLTATAIVGGATQTAAYPMTQTMAALLGPSATPTSQFIFTATPFTTAAPPGSCTYTVQPGDNLFRISLAYNTTVDAIAAANGIVNPQLIVVGQVLVIPGCGNTGQVVPPPGGGSGSYTCTGQTYTVQQGQTLFEISLQFNVPVDAIAACNNISNINLIFINQQLIIPTMT